MEVDGVAPWLEEVLGRGAVAEAAELARPTGMAGRAGSGLGFGSGSESWEALWPIEREALAGAVPSRRHEFTAGRVLARRALARLGIAPAPIPVGESREPIWPNGSVGSISHSSTIVVVVAARSVDVGSIGIDLEVAGGVEQRDWPTVLTPAEQARCGRPGHGDEATVIFSAKEAVYKATYPRCRRWLGFHDVEVDLDPDPEPDPDSEPDSNSGPNPGGGHFRARIAAEVDHPMASHQLSGRFVSVGGHLLTVTSLPAL